MTTTPKKLYLIGGGLILTIALIAVFVIWPLLGLIKSASLELAQKEQAAKLLLEDRQNLEASKKEYREIKNKLAELPILLPQDKAVDFIVALENFAQKTSNHQTISVSAAKNPSLPEYNYVLPKNKPDSPDTLNFQITLGGSFPNLIKFLIHLENAPYFNKIESLQINRLTEKDTQPQSETADLSIGDIKSVINLSVYQQNESATQ